MTATIPLLTFNTRQINADVPIRDVIALYRGVHIANTSKNIKCPSVKHKDKNPSAHIYGNNCKCFGCGGNFSPLTLAKEQYPELSFADVCQRLLDDFNLDVHDYSNMAEIEAVKQAKEENRFYDCFPLTEDEMNFIGLYNPKADEERVYSVKITEYFAFFDGSIPSDVEVYDENGREKMIEVSEWEAIQMDIVPDNIKELVNGFTTPTLQQLWKEDKTHVEEMLIGKCYETLDCIVSDIKAVEQETEQYKTNHTKAEIKEAEKIRNGYFKIVGGGGTVQLSDIQKNKLEGYLAFEQKRDVELPSLNKDKEYVETILDKVLEQQKQREQQERKDGTVAAKVERVVGGCSATKSDKQGRDPKTEKKTKTGWDRE